MPLFRRRLNEQFVVGALNQAFVTEHIAGMETVKALQMEPALERRYGDYLADYVHTCVFRRIVIVHSDLIVIKIRHRIGIPDHDVGIHDHDPVTTITILLCWRFGCWLNTP